MEPTRSKLQILLVTNKFAPEIGGACAVAEALASNLPENVIVAAPGTELNAAKVADWPEYDRRFHFSVLRVASFATELPQSIPRRLRGLLQFAFLVLWTRPRAITSLHRFLSTHPVDVICINTLICYWVPKMLKRRHPELKTVFYVHGEELSGGPKPRRLDQIAHKQLRASDAVVAVSSFTRGLAVGCGVAAEKLTVINNGVDISRFTPGPKDLAIEHRFGLKGKRVLCCLARLDERKGQDKLLEAMPEILAAVPETILLLVGGGDDEARLRQLSQSLDLGDSVIFAGVAADAEVVAYYRTADVYVMPNRTTGTGDTEGFGLVFLEAGACGKPVVGGLDGGVPDAIVDGETGYLVNGRSSKEIAEACIRLLADPVLSERLGEQGLAHSRKTTWKTQSRVFLELCERLCQASRVEDSQQTRS